MYNLMLLSMRNCGCSAPILLGAIFNNMNVNLFAEIVEPILSAKFPHYVCIACNTQ